MTVEPGVDAGPVSDASVVERSWQEPEAFAGLFDRHAVAVHRYVARRLGAEAADDLMAETFTTAFQQRFRYDTERADARPWLFGIATNLVSRHEWSQIHFSLAGLLFRVPVMPEGLRPAAYEALAMVPGVTATPGVEDAKGRKGIAISYESPDGMPGLGYDFIFARGTYAYLGMRGERTSGDGAESQRWIQRSYLADYAVTDRAKQRP